MRTLEQYLSDELAKGGEGHFAIRARRIAGQIHFHIFPSYSRGDLVDFDVRGNELVTTAEQFDCSEKQAAQYPDALPPVLPGYVERSSLPTRE